MGDVTSCIYNVPIFRGLPEPSVAKLRRAMTHRRLEPGTAWIRAGDGVRHLIVVHVGLLRLVRIAASGREQVLRELGPGDFYGELSLFADAVGDGDLVAVAPTEACILDRDAVQKVLADGPEMTLPLLDALARRLFAAERTVAELALYDVGQRLAAELLRLAAAEQRLDALGAEVQLRGEASFSLAGSWAQIAVKLGTTPESLSRRLNALVDAGLIQLKGRRVIILDADSLRETLYAT